MNHQLRMRQCHAHYIATWIDYDEIELNTKITCDGAIVAIFLDLLNCWLLPGVSFVLELDWK